MSKTAYQKQFKKGTYPDQHWDESTRINGHEVASPSVVKKRKAIARGFQTQANPEMLGDSDYSRRSKR